MRFVDLCAGIGGFRLALEQQLGHECVFSCELDPDARACYEANFGGASQRRSSGSDRGQKSTWLSHVYAQIGQNVQDLKPAASRFPYLWKSNHESEHGYREVQWR